MSDSSATSDRSVKIAQGSFTRFVLPFAYDLVKQPETHRGTDRSSDPKEPRLVWKEIDAADRASTDRRLYLTPETCAVLHDRALWLGLRDENTTDAKGIEIPFVAGQKPGSAGAPGTSRKFKRLQPKLVLFEWGVDATNIAVRRSTDQDLLRTGFLLLDIEVIGTQTTLGDLLSFNELFRYWRCPWDGHHAGPDYDGAVSKYHDETAERGEVGPGDDYIRRWQALLQVPVEMDRQRYQLLHPGAVAATATWVKTGNGKALGAPSIPTTPDATPKGRKSEEGGGRPWVVYTDSRSFVWTCALMGDSSGEGAGANALAQAFGGTVATPENFGHWLRLVNVDGPGSTPWETHSAVSSFEKDWIKAATYYRWAHKGCWYGYSQHAGAAIVPPSKDQKDLPFREHFSGIYFDQVLLLLYLRVATFRFSQRLCEISIEARKKGRKHEQKFHEDFQKLRLDFALLTNLYRFPLVSSQQQGIEMYTLARRQLDVDELFAEVEQEIHATEEYLSSRVNLRQATTAAQLQVVATLAIPLGVFLAMAQVCESLNAWKWLVSLGAGGMTWVGTVCLWSRTGRVMTWMRRKSLCFWHGDAVRRRENGPLDDEEESCDE